MKSGRSRTPERHTRVRIPVSPYRWNTRSQAGFSENGCRWELRPDIIVVVYSTRRHEADRDMQEQSKQRTERCVACLDVAASLTADVVMALEHKQLECRS